MVYFDHFGCIFDEIDHSCSEGFDVVGITAGDQIAVRHGRLIDHIRACIAKIRPDRRPAGSRTAPEQIGFDQKPGPVTDCGDGFALSIEVADQPDHIAMNAQGVGIAHAAP